MKKHVVHCARARVGLVLLGLTSVWTFGCGAVGRPDSAGESEPPPAVADPGEPEAARTTDPVDPFDGTVVLTLEDTVRYVIDGRINIPGEVHVYDIGDLLSGDILEIEVIAAGVVLDPMVAVFDADQDAIGINDDRGYYERVLDSYLRFTCTRPTSRGYVVVSSSSKADTTGDYVLYVTRSPGPDAKEPEVQVVYLNFDGAEDVVIGQRPGVDVPAFADSAIATEFPGDLVALLDEAVARVRRDFAGYNVVILSSHEEPPPDEPHTTLHFGSYNALLLGIADYVDLFNQSKTQQAIIFVDTFQAFMPLDPALDEMANALANVTSHEIGHLLGLYHTADPRGIMDTTATLRQMLVPQAFLRSPLGRDAFEIGHQNAPESLLGSVGGSPAVANVAKRLIDGETHDPWYDQGPKASARQNLAFGTACPRWHTVAEARAGRYVPRDP